MTDKKRKFGIKDMTAEDFVAASNWSGKPTQYDKKGNPIDFMEDQPDSDSLHAAGFRDPNPSSTMGG